MAQTKAEFSGSTTDHIRRQNNTRLHVSCPPSRHLTITVSVQLETLISIIISETDGQLLYVFL